MNIKDLYNIMNKLDLIDCDVSEETMPTDLISTIQFTNNLFAFNDINYIKLLFIVILFQIINE